MRRRDFLNALALVAAGACSSGSTPVQKPPITRSNDPAGSTGAGSTASTPLPLPTTTAPPATVVPLEDPTPTLAESVFALGVASGDPAQDSVVLWTRLIGDLPATVPLVWEVALDEQFGHLVATGVVELGENHAHTAHVVAAGLAPAQWYWYRFRGGTRVSPVGRTRTLPAPGQPTGTFRIGVGCCQRRDGGYWSAHQDLAGADIDLMIWLGDFIYSESRSRPLAGRAHTSPDPTTLATYRARYADYRADPALQASSAAHPWMLTWDDHEVANDYDASIDPKRRAAAFQAWWEHQPTRLDPPGDRFDIYRSADIGGLGRIILTDCRQHADGTTLLGAEQQAWLGSALDHDLPWTILGSSVLVGGLLVPTQRDPLLPYTWDGYPSDRAWLAKELARHPNRICVSGDLHVGAALEVRADPADRSLPVVATEFMAPAISSSLSDDYTRYLPLIPLANAHIDYIDSANGWLLLEISQNQVVAQFRTMDEVTLADQRLELSATYTVAAGDPRPVEVD